MTRRRSLLCAALALTVLVAGCTISQMRDENAQTSVRVSDKEAELRRETEAQAQLRAVRLYFIRAARGKEMGHWGTASLPGGPWS